MSHQPLRIAFMGTPDFSVPILAALIDAGYEIAGVYCQPPRAAGRGQKIRLSPVHEYAEQADLEVRTPSNLKTEDALNEFSALNLDVAVVAAYGLILPEPILEAPRLGCINVHASLLPRWRGAAPIQRAIMAGDSETGVTIMQMDKDLDTGPMLISEKINITNATTGGSLRDELAALGARLIVDAMVKLTAGGLTPTPQPDEGITYAEKIDKSEFRIDWLKPAKVLDRQIRAFSPWPGSWFTFGKDRIKIVAVTVIDKEGEAGVILDDQLTVSCGNGALRIERLQRAGKGAMDRADFLRGNDLPAGTRLAPGPAS